MNKSMLFIGELAKQIKINPKTIRYYEEISILPRPKRGTNNYRVYSLDTVNSLSFIRKAQDLGFTLREIKEVLTISDRGNDPCEHVGELLKRRIVDIEKKLMELKSVQTKLKKLEKEWSRIQAQNECDSGELICPKIQRYL